MDGASRNDAVNNAKGHQIRSSIKFDFEVPLMCPKLDGRGDFNCQFVRLLGVAGFEKIGVERQWDFSKFNGGREPRHSHHNNFFNWDREDTHRPASTHRSN